MNPSFQVKTEVFEGPLDLLLSLVEKRKLFVNDISLSQVTDDYISHVSNLPDFSIPDRANFILIASTLLLIKSKSLLPTLNLTEEETQSVADLEKRLALLKRFRELSIGVRELFGANIIFPKNQHNIIQPIFSPDKSMTVTNFLVAIRTVINSLPKKEFLPKVVIDKVISLEEMIENLSKRISGAIKMSFKDFAKVGKEQRTNIIVSFLAMLELVKQGVIRVSQETAFSDIQMESDTVDIPRYN